MAKTYDALVPRSRRPLFPRTCIVCEQPSPTKRVRVSTADTWGSFFKRQSGVSKAADHPFSADAPVHRLCAWRFRLVAYGGLLLSLAVGAPIYFYFYDELHHYIPGRRGPGMAIFFATSPIWVLWMIYFRSPLSIRSVENDIEYTFTSEKFRDEFAEMNFRAAPELESLPQPDDDNPFKGMQL